MLPAYDHRPASPQPRCRIISRVALPHAQDPATSGNHAAAEQRLSPAVTRNRPISLAKVTHNVVDDSLDGCHRPPSH